MNPLKALSILSVVVILVVPATTFAAKQVFTFHIAAFGKDQRMLLNSPNLKLTRGKRAEMWFSGQRLRIIPEMVTDKLLCAKVTLGEDTTHHNLLFKLSESRTVVLVKRGMSIEFKYDG